MGNIYAERIKALRELMKENGWDAVLVGASDPHGSEYPAARWKQVEWLTGFTGEAASVVRDGPKKLPNQGEPCRRRRRAPTTDSPVKFSGQA